MCVALPIISPYDLGSGRERLGTTEEECFYWAYALCELVSLNVISRTIK